MFAAFCSRCSNIFTVERDPATYAEHICPDCKQKPLQVRSKTAEVKHPFLVLGIFIAFIVGLFFVGSWSLDRGDVAPCTPTTRTVKNIQTVNDKVVEFDKQEVEGCITNDGFFIPRPDF